MPNKYTITIAVYAISMQISIKTKYMSATIYHSAHVAICYRHLSGTIYHCKAQYVKYEYY